jgi:hypothetical protein
LIERFNIGVQTGHKEDPENVSTLMRNIKNADGSRRYIKDYIQKFFKL